MCAGQFRQARAFPFVKSFRSRRRGARPPSTPSRSPRQPASSCPRTTRAASSCSRPSGRVESCSSRARQVSSTVSSSVRGPGIQGSKSIPSSGREGTSRGRTRSTSRPCGRAATASHPASPRRARRCFSTMRSCWQTSKGTSSPRRSSSPRARSSAREEEACWCSVRDRSCARVWPAPRWKRWCRST